MPPDRADGRPRFRRDELRALRLMGTLLSAGVVAAGAAVVTRHGGGDPSRARLDGTPPVLIGLTLCAVGLVPLASWARSRRGAARWAIACAALFAALLLATVASR